MIVTFPRFGYTAEIMALFLGEMGIKCIKPEVNNDDVLKIGSQISPEEICLPFKFMAGNLAAAYKSGADTAVMMATCGPCRLGDFCELLKAVLDRAGYRYNWIIIDSPSAIGKKEFLKRLRLLLGENVKKHSVIKLLIKSVTLILRIDSAEDKLKKLNGFTVNKEICRGLLRELNDSVMNFKTLDDGISYIKEFWQRIKTLDVDKTAEPVKILIAGEIYTSIESASNRKVEEKLMSLGCSIQRHMTVSWWMKNTLKKILIPERIHAAGRRDAFAYDIGGYGRETVKKISKAKNINGVIKIMPSGCMPEIVTKSFCEKLQKDGEIKILHLIYDEMSGDAGYETRIEAFADMLERRKDVLAGYRHRIYKH